MNPGEHALMAAAETGYWWYRGLRDLVARVLASASPPLPAHPCVLDAGCGTGENLRFLEGLLAPAYLGGFDASPEAVDFARAKAPKADVYVGDLCDPAIHVGELDLVTSFDVLYIPGVERAREGLRRIVSHLRPGGMLLLNLPAFEWLRSEHDLAVHTSERYTRPQVRELLEELDLSVELLTYRLFLLFPAMLAARLPSMWRGRRTTRDEARSALHGTPGGSVDGLLFEYLRLENRAIARGASLPLGSSVFAAARRR